MIKELNFKDELETLQNFLKQMSETNTDENELLISNDVLEQLGDEMENMVYKVDLNYSSKEGRLLSYNYESDSGFDLYSTEQITIPAFGRALVPTGIVLDIPEGFEVQIRSKSGLALNQGLMVLNSPGTIDQGYIGEIKIILFNTNNHQVIVERGMKVAQAVLANVVSGKFVTLNKIENVEQKERGSNGFGSTGI
ncbi:deoxyuridine 5'-triphosphate nucleotidohydrolase [uncultured Caudovirales phage]|jgi:dUTP pyrophosphatase|uniref:dUTP diphosphatase n=1 Tax=uncultured Caudovirales phage TaxID=2100421 RepID=A0A6J5LAQ5_9CAUD|nr:deoxyuridine 5'-triphosphate nucleotidohydrolase [uncultured Caudovirales phage]